MSDSSSPAKSVFEMIGEFFREAAVLIMVFSVLDQVISPQGVQFWLVLLTLLVTTLFLYVGIKFEQWRRP